jgi:adenosine kinase
MSKILVTGSIAHDTIIDCDASFMKTIDRADQRNLSVSFEVQNMKKKYGGTGTNIAWNLRLLGNETMLVGTIGEDGLDLKQKLEKRGIDTRHMEVLPGEHTSFAIMSADREQHQITFFGRGADAKGTWPEISAKSEEICYAIIGPRTMPMMMAGLEWCRKNDVPAIFDPGQDIRLFDTETLQRAVTSDIAMICNEYEWDLISKKLGHSAVHMGKELRFLIVTESDKGFSIYTKDGAERFARCDADGFVNPSGAGDGFRGGLITGLTRGWSLEDSAKLGASLASFVVEQEGTLLESIDMTKIYERAKSAYGKELPAL